MSHSKNTIASYQNGAPIILQSDLPYCLTERYQELVSKIQSNPNRGLGKKTGIWDPKEKND